MALEGTFLADFASFYDAVQKAEVSLKSFETGAAKVETSLNKMVDSFSGRKLIQDATLAAEAVERIGGVSKLTAAELERVSRQAEEAVAKMRALGQDAPAALVKLADARKQQTDATNAQTAANDKWATSLSQVEGILGQFGIDLGGAGRSLGELEGFAGKSAASLGTLGVAAAATAAFFAGWEIGKQIDAWTGLSGAISEATSKLVGWGDVAAQTAAARAEMLAKASAEVGYSVTSVAVAAAILEGAAQHNAEAFGTLEAMVKGWQAELANAADSGKMAEIAAALESHNFTLQQIEKQYGVSVAALQYYVREQAKAAEAEKAIDDLRLKNFTTLHNAQLQLEDLRVKQQARALLETTKLWDEYYNLVAKKGATANDQAIADIRRWSADVEAQAKKAGANTTAFYEALRATTTEKLSEVGVEWSLWSTRSRDALREMADNALKTYNAMIVSGQFFREDLDKQLAKYHELDDAARGYGNTAKDAQDKARAATEAANKALERQAKLEEDARKNREMGASWQFDLSTEAGRAKVPGEIATWLHDGYSLEQAMAIAFHLAWGIPIDNNDPLFKVKGPRVPGFAGGVQNFWGGLAMVGERGPELVNLPGGADVVPLDRGGGLGGGVTVTVNVSGILDPRTKGELGRIMNESVTRAILGGRKMGLA